MFTAEGLLAFHDWTHRTYALLLDHAAKLPKTKLNKKLEGFGFPTVRSQLIHIAGAEHFWVNAAIGRRYRGWNYTELMTVDAIRPKFKSTKALTRRYIKETGNKGLMKPVRVRFPGGGGLEISPALMIHHFLTHGFHHKGQAVAMCRLLGYPPPETDMDAIASP
jgi:uncharacterized damage-inducible protein DinB